MADIITTGEYAAATGESASDPKLEPAIARASAAIRNYVARNIGDPAVTTTKTYPYDGSGFVEIDDAGAITAVSVNGSDLTLGTAAVPEPYGGPVYTWIELAPSRWASPEMGFASNLDTLWPGYVSRPIVTVTGTFGWPTIPDDIKQAAIWTVQAWLQDRQGDLTGESIATFARQYAFRQGSDTGLAIPTRARDLLAAYRREVLV